MGRPAWQIRAVIAFWPLKNLLAKMVGWPVIGRWMRFAFRGDRASYIPVHAELEGPGSVALPGRVVEHFIEEASFRFVLHQCLCRSLEMCSNYPKEIGCLFLGEGAKEIACSLGREATVGEALAHHRKAIGLGLIPMVGKLRWDSLWLGVKRREQFLTICHCCDCCCYFRLYRYLPGEIARSLQKLEGLDVQVGEACDGCGTCVERCFIRAMRLRDGKAEAGEECRGCGRCAQVCPKKAVQMIIRPPGR